MTLHEIHLASSLIQEAADEDANIIFGSVIDPSMGKKLKVTVIATGFEKAIAHAEKEELRKPSPALYMADVPKVQQDIPTIIRNRWEQERQGSKLRVTDRTDLRADVRHELATNNEYDVPAFLRRKAAE